MYDPAGVIVRRIDLPELSVYLETHDIVDGETLKAQLAVASRHGNSWTLPIPDFSIRPQPAAKLQDGRAIFAYWSGTRVNVAYYDVRAGIAVPEMETRHVEPTPEGQLHGLGIGEMTVVVAEREKGHLDIIEVSGEIRL